MAVFQAEHDFVNDYYHLYMDEKRSFTYNVLADEINCFLYYNIDDELIFLKKVLSLIKYVVITNYQRKTGHNLFVSPIKPWIMNYLERNHKIF